MKIDMLSMTVNNSINNDSKTEKSEIAFSSILENKVDNISFKDSYDEETEIKDELLQVICSLISNLKINNTSFESSNLEDLDSNIERINPETLSGLNTKLNDDKISIILNDMNLNSSEVKFINSKLEEIINRTVESVNKELKDTYKSNLLINDKSITEDRVFEAIKKSLENNLNKESNNIKIENLLNNNFKQIQYVEDNSIDKDKNILLKISKGNSDTILPTKDIELNDNELNILNNISNLENNLSKDIADIKPIEIRSNYIAEDIGQAIKYIKNNGVEDLILKINPKELGELTIKLIKDKEGNKVVITSSSNETFKLINENIKDIENHLTNLDIKLNQVSVEIKSYVQNDFSGDLNQQFNGNTSKEERRNTFAKEENLKEEIEKVSEETNINLLI